MSYPICMYSYEWPTSNPTPKPTHHLPMRSYEFVRISYLIKYVRISVRSGWKLCKLLSCYCSFYQLLFAPSVVRCSVDNGIWSTPPCVLLPGQQRQCPISTALRTPQKDYQAGYSCGCDTALSWSSSTSAFLQPQPQSLHLVFEGDQKPQVINF